MKHLMTTMAVAGALALASGVANAGSKEGEALAKKDGCLMCHDVAKKKVGPAYKDVAARFKKEGLTKDKIVADVKAKHATVKASDDDLKEIAEWLLSM